MSINRWSKWFASFVLLTSLFAVNLILPSTVFGGPPQSSDVYAPLGCLPDNCNDVGDSQLVRTPNGVSMNLQTTELDAGAAYTVWWIIFNNPEYCQSTPCGPGDLLPNGGDPMVDSSVVWATGHVIGGTGAATFAAHLQVDKPKGQVLFGNGLQNAQGAEIHLVVRSHGQPIPGQVDEQISTFEGGCDVNVCEDQQFTIHLP